MNNVKKKHLSYPGIFFLSLPPLVVALEPCRRNELVGFKNTAMLGSFGKVSGEDGWGWGGQSSDMSIKEGQASVNITVQGLLNPGANVKDNVTFLDRISRCVHLFRTSSLSTTSCRYSRGPEG